MDKNLIKWSLANFSHLPWRQGRTLYTTLVSEIMLQQTTVPTVLNYFENFLKKYPDIKTLSETTDEDLHLSWKGLGYYRRAENLLKAAKFIVQNYSGKIPLDYEKLILIPGIGQYTANAIISIGGNCKALTLDANLERVLGRFYLIKGEKGPKLQKLFYEKFSEGKILKNIESLGSSKLSEALMDLGRTLCKPTAPKCTDCPLKLKCQANIQDKISEYPYSYEEQSKNKTEFKNLKLLRIFVINEGKILVYQKNSKEWLKNQFEVPTFVIDSDDKNFFQYPKLKKSPIIKYLETLPTYKSNITKYKITNLVHIMSLKDFQKEFNFERNAEFKVLNFEKENLASNLKKALKFLPF